MGRKLPPLYPPAGEYSVREIVTATMLAEQERQLSRIRQENNQMNTVRQIHAGIMATRNEPRRAA